MKAVAGVLGSLFFMYVIMAIATFMAGMIVAGIVLIVSGVFFYIKALYMASKNKDLITVTQIAAYPFLIAFVAWFIQVTGLAEMFFLFIAGDPDSGAGGLSYRVGDFVASWDSTGENPFIGLLSAIAGLVTILIVAFTVLSLPWVMVYGAFALLFLEAPEKGRSWSSYILWTCAAGLSIAGIMGWLDAMNMI